MKIIIGTGGSGGHIFPALKVARGLREDGHRVMFVGALNLVLDKLKDDKFDIFNLPARGFSSASLDSFFISFFCMIKAICQSFRVLRNFKPDVVCGFGGYGSFPIVFAAALLRYSTLIHEQNVMPGRANAFLARFVSKIALSFKRTQQYFPARKVVLTGCPCHTQDQFFLKEELFDKFHLNRDKFTILVFGGSQGSHRINHEFMQAVRLLKDRLEFQAIHITGGKDYEYFQDCYKDMDCSVSLFDFLNEIQEAYSLADLVISRAGAATVTEIANFAVPSILIPYPFAKGHQKANASVLRDANIADVIEEEDLSSDKLKDAILNFYEKRITHQQIKERLKGLFVSDATTHLVQEITGGKNEN